MAALARPFRGFFRNQIFVSVVLGTAVVQALIVEFGGKAIHTRSLTGGQCGACLAFGAGGLVWNTVIHYIFPWSWIPTVRGCCCCWRRQGTGRGSCSPCCLQWLEPGAYTDLVPDRTKEDEEESPEATEPALPPHGLDSPVLERRSSIGYV